MPSLSTPLSIGPIPLSHRLIMAPLTRFRVTSTHIPIPLATTYYAQRASVPGTLLISEATLISPRASGYAHVPGIWSGAQIAQWRLITDAVHAQHSYIYCQLWALGRRAEPADLQAKGFDVVGPSALAPEKGQPVPRPMTEEEIWAFVADYAQAARNAIEAGFDGVEIHGANGYLVDQFLQDGSNVREDAWGGSVARRARFGLEVARAVVEAIGAERTGIKLSPFNVLYGMGMQDPKPQFSYLLEGLKALKLAYVHLVKTQISGPAEVDTTRKVDFAINVWGNTSPVLLAGGFTAETAQRAVEEEYGGSDVAIVFGRYFVSNPDLPFRVLNGVELAVYDRETFYTPESAVGYVDYPFSTEFEGETSRV